MKKLLCLALLIGLLPLAEIRAAELSDIVRIDWSHAPDRIWLGPHVWGNRLHDWRVKNGRLECVASQPRLAMRTAHLLGRQLTARNVEFSMQVKAGLVNAKGVSPTAAVGFLIGVGGKEMHPWSAAIVHQWPGPGAGFFAGVTADGRAFIRDFSRPRTNPTPKRKAAGKAKGAALPASFTLRLTAKPQAGDRCRLTFEVRGAAGKVFATTETTVPSERLIGNVALVSHPGRNVGGTTGRFWFNKWELSGRRLKHVAEKPGTTLREADVSSRFTTFGPIVGTQYTLSRGVLKLTVQMAPIGKDDNNGLWFCVKNEGKWTPIASTKVVTPGWTGTFRIPKWDATKNVPYQIQHFVDLKQNFGVMGEPWEGTIRRDPVDKPTIVIAGFTGNHNNAGFIGSPRTDWKTGMFFPHADVAAAVAKHKPDLLFFSGDQVYEGRSPTFADRDPKNIKLDYMYKWYLWVLAYRGLTKDIPAITMPDDHDVYQGNLWGQGGRPVPRQKDGPGRDHDGGYVHPADFVKMVERTQTSHLPDPYDPTPVGQGIGVYYSHLVWGRISVAILEDRKFKSGCNRKDMPPSGTGRPDHFNDPKFDVKKLDIPGVELLGKRQEKFLKDWGSDWRGTDMKMAVSQTIFANMATHHGGNLQRLIADLDSNGWPQSGRNRAIDLLRRAFAFHLAGDQHLATIVHHGIKDHGDAGWSFCVPSVANFYPRAWAPEAKGKYVYPKPEQYLGKRRDGFGHPVIVYGATNPGISTGKKPAALHDRMPGYGIVKFNKAKRTIRMECWPRWADPANPKHKPYFGWPKTISQLDNYLRKPAGYLPTIKVMGMSDPVVQVVNEKSGEVEYTLRIKGREFRPFVFAAGKYTVRVGELGTQRIVVVKGLSIADRGQIDVSLPGD